MASSLSKEAEDAVRKWSGVADDELLEGEDGKKGRKGKFGFSFSSLRANRRGRKSVAQ